MFVVSGSIYDYQVKIGDMLGTKYRVAESLGKVGGILEHVLSAALLVQRVEGC